MADTAKHPVLWVVIPCYNEEQVLPQTAPLFLNELRSLIESGRISSESRILFVDDGSSDTTWSIITGLAEQDPHFIGIRQSRNRGQQNSFVAGLMEAKDTADVTITADCDGQDDITVMGSMIDEYLNGAELVYSVRSKRDKDTFFKRFTAESYYKLLNAMGADIPYNSADYRLLGSKALNSLAEFKEVNIYLRGMVTLLGYKSAVVSYERQERMAGTSRYPLPKLLRLAFDGITSFSTAPVILIILLGIFITMLGLAGIAAAAIMYAAGNTAAGLTAVISTICGIGGMQLAAIGVVGIYAGKTYMEAKHRPRYIISERTWR